MLEQLLVPLVCIRCREIPGRGGLEWRRNIGVVRLVACLRLLFQASNGIESGWPIQTLHSRTVAIEEASDGRLANFLS